MSASRWKVSCRKRRVAAIFLSLKNRSRSDPTLSGLDALRAGRAGCPVIRGSPPPSGVRAMPDPISCKQAEMPSRHGAADHNIETELLAIENERLRAEVRTLRSALKAAGRCDSQVLHRIQPAPAGVISMAPPAFSHSSNAFSSAYSSRRYDSTSGSRSNRGNGTGSSIPAT
jgi:hypothetical protein